MSLQKAISKEHHQDPEAKTAELPEGQLLLEEQHRYCPILMEGVQGQPMAAGPEKLEHAKRLPETEKIERGLLRAASFGRRHQLPGQSCVHLYGRQVPHRGIGLSQLGMEEQVPGKHRGSKDHWRLSGNHPEWPGRHEEFLIQC